jgi:hypothetical protein
LLRSQGVSYRTALQWCVAGFRVGGRVHSGLIAKQVNSSSTAKEAGQGGRVGGGGREREGEREREREREHCACRIVSMAASNCPNAR